MDKKEELLTYFEDEIEQVSTKEITSLKHEIEDIRTRTLAEMETAIKAEVDLVFEQEIHEIDSDHAIALSHLNDENNRKLMAERERLVNLVFQDAEAKLEDFMKGPQYSTKLQAKLQALKDKGLAPAILSVRPKDEALLPELLKAYGCECEGTLDEDIRLGGFRLEAKEKGIIVDETFDAALAESRQWFYDNSRLTIR